MDPFNKFLKILFWILILTLPLGQFTRLPLAGNGEIRIYLNDGLLPILILIWLFWKLNIKRSLTLPPFTSLIAVWISIALISLIFGLRYVGLNELMVGSFYLIRWAEYAMLYPITLNLIGNKDEAGRISRALILGGGVFAILGLVQFVIFPDFSKLVKSGWDPHYYRVLSTFFDPNFAGIFMVLSLIFIFSFLAQGIHRLGLKSKLSQKLGNLILVGLVPIVVLSIILTLSRSTYLALGVTVLIFGILKSKKTLFLVFLAMSLAVLFIPRVKARIQGAIRPDMTAKLRILNWQQAGQIIQDNPILGVGFNTYRYAQERYGFFKDKRGVDQEFSHSGAGADSSLLFVGATTGIIGLVFYLILLGRIWWFAFLHRDNPIGLTLTVGLPALVIHSQFVNSLFYPWIMEWVWIVAALMIFQVTASSEVT